MPRQTESPEARILRWFQTENLAAVNVLYGLVKDAVKGRQPKAAADRHPLTAHARAQPRTQGKKKSHHKQVASGGEKNWTSPHEHPTGHKPTRKKRTHHKRARPTNGAEGAEVEEFGAGE
jgi:hypothetical protein